MLAVGQAPLSVDTCLDMPSSRVSGHTCQSEEPTEDTRLTAKAEDEKELESSEIETPEGSTVFALRKAHAIVW